MVGCCGAISLSIALPAGGSTLQQAVDAGQAIKGSMDFYVGGVRYLTNSGSGLVIEIADDLESGTFTGPFSNLDGGGTLEVTGNFDC